MGMFKAKKSDLASGPDIPLDQVNAMKTQGYSNNQIIQSLQRDGYTSSQIFDAISQSEMTNKVPSQNSFNQQQNIMQQAEQIQMPSPMQQQGMNMPQMQGMPMMGNRGMAGPSTEEIVEAIIDEKWNELVKDINKIIEWKQKADVRLGSMEQQITDLKEQFDKLHQAILGKIGDYDKNMMDVGAELQAMEKVFSKVLPGFVDNVNELTRITDKMKSAEKIKSAPLAKSKKFVEKDEDDS
ncbi:MAG: hypothetical protein WC916_03630 [Candidatus Woesearchaeota archaeon]